jgi:exodeoxyribonuclease VII small subunit
MQKAPKDLTYEAAFNELKEIAAAIENEAVTVDVLASKVKRASELIQYCQTKLRSTETEINSIIKKMDGRE